MYINIKRHGMDTSGHEFEFFLLRPWNFFINSPLFGELHGHLAEKSSGCPFYEKRNEPHGFDIWLGRWEFIFRRPKWARRAPVAGPQVEA